MIKRFFQPNRLRDLVFGLIILYFLPRLICYLLKLFIFTNTGVSPFIVAPLLIVALSGCIYMTFSYLYQMYLKVRGKFNK